MNCPLLLRKTRPLVCVTVGLDGSWMWPNRRVSYLFYNQCKTEECPEVDIPAFHSVSWVALRLSTRLCVCCPVAQVLPLLKAEHFAGSAVEQAGAPESPWSRVTGLPRSSGLVVSSTSASKHLLFKGCYYVSLAKYRSCLFWMTEISIDRFIPTCFRFSAEVVMCSLHIPLPGLAPRQSEYYAHLEPGYRILSCMEMQIWPCVSVLPFLRL